MIIYIILFLAVVFLYFYFSKEKKIPEKPTFTKDIAPIFRPFDISAMKNIIDFTDYNDVRDNAEIIYKRTADGTMPCDGGWDRYKIELFRRWIDSGMEK